MEKILFDISAPFPAADKRVIENDELLGLLPHKGKMLLISRVIEYDINAHTLISEYDVSPACLFYDPALGGVPAYMSFEFMAQAVSAHSGICGRVMGKPPLLGFILSVSSLEIRVPLFMPGEVVRTEAAEEGRAGEAATWRCSVSVNGAEAARARLTLMDVEDPSVFGVQNGN
jgi:predicted hotdog family 3-hydroxylacyl-ACP dehydratase